MFSFFKKLFGGRDVEASDEDLIARANETVRHYRQRNMESLRSAGLNLSEEEYDAISADDEDDDDDDDDDRDRSEWERIKLELPNPEGADWITHKGWMNIAGLNHRKTEAARFVKHALPLISSAKIGLTLQREPENQHDPNAIKVFGWLGKETSLVHLGYVPAHAAAEISAYPRDMPVAARPTKLGFISGGDHVFISFALLIPSAKQRKREGWILPPSLD